MVHAADRRWCGDAHRDSSGISGVAWLHSDAGRRSKVILRSRESRHASGRGRLLRRGAGILSAIGRLAVASLWSRPTGISPAGIMRLTFGAVDQKLPALPAP